MHLIKMRISIKTIPKHPLWFLAYSYQCRCESPRLIFSGFANGSCPASSQTLAKSLLYREWAKCGVLLYGLWGTSEPLCWKRRKAQVPTHYFVPFHMFSYSVLWPMWKISCAIEDDRVICHFLLWLLFHQKAEIFCSRSSAGKSQ